MTLINQRAKERGVALILALGLLVVIAAVALIVAVTSIMERGLTASERQQKVAFDSMQRVMEKAISQFNPRIDITGTGYPGLADTMAWGGNFQVISWLGTHDDSLIQKNPIHPLDFPRGMHQVGEAIYTVFPASGDGADVPGRRRGMGRPEGSLGFRGRGSLRMDPLD